MFGYSLAPDGSLPRRSLSFAAASTALILCFFIASIPVPMMAVWTQSHHLSTSQIAFTVVSYFAGCIFTLIFLARLSNFLGRKPAVLLSLTLGILANVLFCFSTQAYELYLGRFLQGLCCGLISSSGMSWVVDTSPSKRAWLGTALTAAGPNIGLAAGTLATGFILEYGLLDPTALFVGGIVLLTCCCALVCVGSETLRFGTEPLLKVLTPRVALPPRLCRLFVVAAAGFMGTWGIGAFFQGFSAHLATALFNDTNAFYSGLTYLFIIVPNATAGILIGRYRPSRALPVLFTLFFISANCLFIALSLENLPFFITATVCCGFASGGICTAALKFLILDTTIKERAGVIAALYLLAYCGSGTPNLLIGTIGASASQATLNLGFHVWILLAFSLAMGMFLIIRAHPSEAESLRYARYA